MVEAQTVEQKTKAKHTLKIIEERCKGCEICVVYCPEDVLAMKDSLVTVVNINKCTGCLRCELFCPDFAIYVDLPEKPREEK
ncbi:MAG: 4Fe-4S binding protein [Deltaproteobacteria bacterium]|nr:4Fe-4S binding protein [Deltaproteobacteria bacterium]MCL5792483.1 4Fe-4S binding protein [Deltaproteobacteria bacterium]